MNTYIGCMLQGNGNTLAENFPTLPRELLDPQTWEMGTNDRCTCWTGSNRIINIVMIIIIYYIPYSYALSCSYRRFPCQAHSRFSKDERAPEKLSEPHRR